ncbi:MAG: hypothetical protein S4CHLAM2_17000 [Chlamydiales bacterium]|nr:hypothetical protein [Chlamydiales bacterium]
MESHEENGGLTTTQAPFIEQARQNGEIFIHQPYTLYSAENQQVWSQLYALMRPKWEKYANAKFMEGIDSLCLRPDRIPRLEEINQFLQPLTGFEAKAVSGYVPTYTFFDSLRERKFPTTITIRDGEKLHYLPEPDIFHDIAGHVPMHTDPMFAKVLVKFGSLARLTAQQRPEIMASNVQALARFFWFTIEFGLMRQNGALCVYGSGLLSSADEIKHAIESPKVQRVPFQLEWVINQSFAIDRFQPLLFIIDSFEHLYEQVHLLEEWLHAGKLESVAPGEPEVSEAEINVFREAE